MLLTLGTCISRAATIPWEYILRYPCWHHPDNNVFWWLKQHLHEAGSVTPIAHVNAGRAQTMRMPANEDPIIVTVEWDSWKSSHDITWELRLSQLRVIEVLHDNQMQPYDCLWEQIYFQTFILYRCNFLNGYDINTVWMTSFYITSCGQTKHILHVRVCSTSTTVTSDHRMILELSCYMQMWIMKYASASAFGLE